MNSYLLSHLLRAKLGTWCCAASRLIQEISSSHKELSRALKGCSIEQSGVGGYTSKGSRNYLCGVQSPVVLENPEPCLSPPLASWRLEKMWSYAEQPLRDDCLGFMRCLFFCFTSACISLISVQYLFFS